MRFKFIFIIFNIIIIFFLLIICLIPLFILGSEFFLKFWHSLMPMVLIIGLSLIILDIFYFSNRRLFILLEREDYPALTGYLEMRVLRKGHYAPPLVRLLANTYLVMSDAAAVIKLENSVALVKPALIGSNALIFGVARLLGGDNAGAVRFFSARLDPAAEPGVRVKKLNNRDLPWVRWYYGFSLLLDRQYTPAAEQFKVLAEESPDALIAGLSAYFLGNPVQRNTENPALYLTAARESRSRIQQFVKGPAAWQAEAEKLKTEVHAIILQRYINEAGSWLFE
ncbi:hypothetical protein AGMMS49546_28400 [Spirochaetia bacterium]|nr:hypothetical protein AGMMS49546_28400 [Spirochaetia bacterium]